MDDFFFFFSLFAFTTFFEFLSDSEAWCPQPQPLGPVASNFFRTGFACDSTNWSWDLRTIIHVVILAVLHFEGWNVFYLIGTFKFN